MRPIVLASALLAALAIPAIAYATPTTSPTTYFHLSIDGGRSLSFSLDPSKIYASSPGDVDYSTYLSDGSFAAMAFVTTAFAQANGYGALDFEIVLGGAVFYVRSFDGPELYTGGESNPIFIPGSYDLTGNPLDGQTTVLDTARLTISQTPEPSSLLLLGTGVLGCVGALRRRFLKA